MARFGWVPHHGVPDSLNFDRIEPTEVLYEFDIPRIFTVESGDSYLLFYMAGEDGEHVRYVVAPTTRAAIDDLKVGARAVRDVLEQSIVWIVDATWDGFIESILRTSSDRIPNANLPKPGTMLLPSLQPLISLRYTGPAFEPGALKASVLQATIQRAVAGLKLLGGRDPVVQRLQVGSLELDFAADPVGGQSNLKGTGRDLISIDDQGLEAALISLETVGELVNSSSQTLKILEDIALPKSPGLDRVEISGRLFKNNRRFVLDREQSRQIRNAVMHFHSAIPSAEELRAFRPETVQGQIRKFDKDTLTFSIRPARGRKSLIKCKISADQLPQALHLFVEEHSTEVSGFSDGRDLHVDHIRAVPNLPNL